MGICGRPPKPTSAPSAYSRVVSCYVPFLYIVGDRTITYRLLRSNAVGHNSLHAWAPARLLKQSLSCLVRALRSPEKSLLKVGRDRFVGTENYTAILRLPFRHAEPPKIVCA